MIQVHLEYCRLPVMHHQAHCGLWFARVKHGLEHVKVDDGCDSLAGHHRLCISAHRLSLVHVIGRGGVVARLVGRWGTAADGNTTTGSTKTARGVLIVVVTTIVVTTVVILTISIISPLILTHHSLCLWIVGIIPLSLHHHLPTSLVPLGHHQTQQATEEEEHAPQHRVPEIIHAHVAAGVVAAIVAVGAFVFSW